VTLRLAHLSDIHFGGENPRAVAAVFAWLVDERPDLVIISGDLTVAGAKAEFAAAAAWISALERHGLQVLSLPGNHDTPEFDLPRRMLDPWGRWRRHIGPSDNLGHSAPGLTLTAFNSARGVQPRMNWSKGAVDRRQARAAVARLTVAPAGDLRVAVCHHPLVELPDGPMTGRVWGGPAAARRLAEAGADMVLTGHIHSPFAMPLPYGDGQTLAVGAGTLSVRERGAPPGFNRIEADALEIRITALAWSEQGLAPWMTWAVPRRRR
jgi:3',5'-cyclic AMP phosphodiesterase CpdA